MRFLKFKRWLTQLYRVDGFDEVVFEEVRRHLSTDSAHVYGGFLSVLTSLCEEWKVPYVGIPVGTIKKFTTGKGNAGKEEVIDAVKSWDFSPCDDNEADAIAILKCHFSSI